MTLTRDLTRTLFLLATLTALAIGAFAQQPSGDPSNPDGDPIGRGNEVHDQRAGSMLIYNYYTSKSPGTQNTLLTFTNTHSSSEVYVRLAFVEGTSGQPAFGTLNLAPGQTQNFLASDVDPNTTGYLIATATDYAGATIQFDFLMGMATITLASGHQATLGALAVPINPNYSYAALPRQLALDQVPSPLDYAERLLIINRIDGDLTGAMPAIGALQTDLYNDQGKRLTFTSPSQGPQATILANNLFNLRVDWSRFLRAGRYGWLKIRPTGGGAVTGAVLYFTRNSKTLATSPASGSYNLRHMTSTQATLQTDGGTLYFGY
jgi:hypothetical protein